MFIKLIESFRQMVSMEPLIRAWPLVVRIDIVSGQLSVPCGPRLHAQFPQLRRVARRPVCQLEGWVANILRPCPPRQRWLPDAALFAGAIAICITLRAVPNVKIVSAAQGRSTFNYDARDRSRSLR